MTASNPYQSPPDPQPNYAPSEDARLSQEIVLEGSMPIRDVLHTQILILSKRWIYAVLCLGLYVAFVVALGTLNPSGGLFGSTFMVLGLIVMPAILPFTLLMVYLRLLKDARRKVGIFAETKTVLAAEGIRSTVNGEATPIPWSTFNGFLCSQRVVLLFLKGSSNHLIVSRTKLAHAEDWYVLLEFLHQRFPKR